MDRTPRIVPKCQLATCCDGALADPARRGLAARLFAQEITISLPSPSVWVWVWLSSFGVTEAVLLHAASTQEAR